ncbi:MULTISPECIES: S8 family peptidase [Streptomyces]|uniref:Serine protease n=2 Tax=Streptomyces TaxID=1883 RepID=A0A0W7X8M9_9ACTN|nr:MULTISPECIES: S8 family peptidase [Streptomyces]KUF19334.1 serine protease [Streptomyces silvensis]MVO89253.1 S8 family serine peptidase [Streptomyces typhae]
MKPDARALRRALAVGASTALLVGAASTVGAAASPAPPGDGDGRIVGADRPGAVDGSYIVTLKDSVARRDIPGAAKALARQHEGDLRYTYTAALRGFAVRMSEGEAEKLAADPSVARVEADAVAYAVDTQTNPPSWGLDRVDQRDLPVDKKYTYGTTASNVNAYIVDTGIRMSHRDFGGRAVSGYDFIDNDSNASDCQGHGTHVAGTVGGGSYGVAKGVKLIGVRVLNCQGNSGDTWAPVLAGIDWVTKNAVKPAVGNMSIGGGRTQSVNDAVTSSIASGVTWVVAAGNNNADSCSYSPSSTPTAITVGATNSRDARATGWSNGQGSNYGSCLDIFAPGDSIVSSSNSGDSNAQTMSGTSMASPHVAGAAALLLSANPSWTPAQVRDKLVADATSDKVTDARSGSPNKLLYTGGGSTNPPTGKKFENTDDHQIRDNATVESPLTVTGVTGKAPADLAVTVDIRHTFRGDLKVELVAPDGTAHLLKDYDSNDGADNVQATYRVDASAETADGTWKLRVSDNWDNDTGYVNAWSLQF